jgi:hypothetical protein
MIVERGNKALVAGTLARWRQDADLGGIRDARERAKLPESEQAALERFWDDVDGLLARIKGSQ